MRYAPFVLSCWAVFSLATSAGAQEPQPQGPDASASQAPSTAQTPRPVAIDYSGAYETRAKIHKYASFATLPLFATELALGQSIYNDPNARDNAARGAHIAVGTAITGLFAVNSVTGVWNLWESRKDPNHRTRNLVHGILMLGADAGFVGTFATGPGHERGGGVDDGRQLHRAMAVTSIGLATTSYLIMLFGK
jgi:hypothetical protein